MHGTLNKMSFAREVDSDTHRIYHCKNQRWRVSMVVFQELARQWVMAIWCTVGQSLITNVGIVYHDLGCNVDSPA